MNLGVNMKDFPQWNDPAIKAGTKIRTALWLLGEVGVGQIFTKEQHRQAFPGVAQADRRLRDLRAAGWVIHTNLEDASLNSNEQRFVAAGTRIWESTSLPGTAPATVTAKQRRAIFAVAGYQCSVCGIAGGESYPDSPWMSATLSITSRTLRKADGTSELRHVAECKRCQSGGDNRCDDVADLIFKISKLSEADKRAIIYLTSQTAGSALLKVWSNYRHFSPPARLEIRSSILEMDLQPKDQ
jgi:hypothetical protein